MNNRFFQISLISLVLILLLAAPVLAAAACPSDCSCLLPAEAKKLGLPGYCNGKQVVCGYDSAKNEKYCYEKSASFSPVLVVTTKKPVVVTTTTKATVTTTRTTAPLIAGPTRVVPVTCPSGCECMPDEKAQGAAVPLSLCSGTKSYCGSTADGTPMYCYAVTAATTITPTTTIPVTRVVTVPCTSGCSCLATDKADAAGYKQCSGQAQPCDYDPAGNPMACYFPITTVPSAPKPVMPLPATTVTPGSSGEVSVPVIRPETTVAAPAPVRSGDIFEVIGAFFGGLFGGGTVSDPTLVHPSVNTVEPGNSQVSISACQARGLTACNEACTDISTDINNCGKCGTACYADEICCGGTCVRNGTGENCGACGNSCPAGSPCQNGMCDSWGCYYGTTACANACVDLMTDRSNCGSCGNDCTPVAVCDDGTCKVCRVGTTMCGNECIDTSEDRRNCGVCRNACGDDEICNEGTCSACSGMTADRCGNTCVNLNTNADNCGSCGNVCPEGLICSAGECVCPGHEEGMISCPALPRGSVVCVDPMTDPNNCGGCGAGLTTHRCIGDTTTCCSGVCTDLQADRHNCGSCGYACPDDKVLGAARCRMGDCIYCDHGTHGCVQPDGSVHCLDLKTSAQNCGTCGNRCAEGETCCNGICANLKSDRENCNSCGHSCASGELCCGGKCTDVLFDDDNCGSCDRICDHHKWDTCISGRCCNNLGTDCL